MPPKVLVKQNDRAGGVLPVSAAARAVPTKGPAARLKLEVRRLPPGLTLTEFEEILGNEWRLGSGKIDWREYRQGKIKTSAGKIPEQSRCYIHLVNEAGVKDFEARFFNVTFQDRAGTHRNHELRHLPPTLAFAPNQRTPLNVKVRTDNRQGTIDQDPEFIAFLEAETQPIVKPAALDAVGVEKKEVEKVEIKSTPLIDALREKKANKAKAAASKEEKKEGKGHAKSESKDVTADQEKSTKEGKGSHKKGDQTSKENAKAVNKQIVTKQQQQPRAASPQQPATKPASPAKTKKAAANSKTPNASPAQSANATTATPASPNPAPQRGSRQRGNADGIKKMLQKDLGIRPKNAATTPSPSNPASTNPASTPTAAISNPSPSHPNPRNVKSPPTTKSTPASAATSGGTTPGATNSANSLSPAAAAAATPPLPKAYLKHANPSQGMTEILIQQALSAHGEVASVTIDPRKGTAVAIFKNAEGLKKAIEARKVAVANGSVEVLEFRERAAQGGGGGGNAGGASGGGGGGGGGGRGGHRGRGGRGGGKAGGNANANANASGANPGAGSGSGQAGGGNANAGASVSQGQGKGKEG